MARWLIRSAQPGVGVETQYSYRLVMQRVQGESYSHAAYLWIHKVLYSRRANVEFYFGN